MQQILDLGYKRQSSLNSHLLEIMPTPLGHERPLPLGKSNAQSPQHKLLLHPACLVTALPVSQQNPGVYWAAAD